MGEMTMSIDQAPARPKRRKKAAADADSVVCSYQVRIGDAPITEEKAEPEPAVV